MTDTVIMVASLGAVALLIVALMAFLRWKERAPRLDDAVQDKRLAREEERQRRRNLRDAAEQQKERQMLLLLFLGCIGFGCWFLFLWASPLYRESRGSFVGDRDIPGRTVLYLNASDGCWRVVRHNADLIRRERVGQICRETDSGDRYVLVPTGAPNEWGHREPDEFFGRWWRGL